MAGGNAIRGSRVGAGPMGEAERGESAPRQRASRSGAPTTTRPAVVRRRTPPIPETWDCPRCGYPAGRDQANTPGAADKTEPYKTHLAYVRERRTDADGEAILSEALAAPAQRLAALGDLRPGVAARSSSSHSVRSRPRDAGGRHLVRRRAGHRPWPTASALPGAARPAARPRARRLSARQRHRDPRRRRLGAVVHGDRRRRVLADAGRLREDRRDVALGPDAQHAARRSPARRPGRPLA